MVIVWFGSGWVSNRIKKGLCDENLENSVMKYWLFREKKGGRVQKAKKMAYLTEGISRIQYKVANMGKSEGWRFLVSRKHSTVVI